MTLTLSVIVPVYNAENCLGKCVDSLVNQTYKNLEIIPVNDGSTDGSAALCDALAAQDDRIKVIHKPNGGVSSARNAGLDAATGQYITFADSDDWLDSDAYSKCMSEAATADADLVVFGYETHLSYGNTKTYMDCNMFTRYEYKENIARYISTGVGFNAVWNKVFRARIIDDYNIRFDETMQINEDGVFNCRFFAAAGHIRCIPDIFYHYNMLGSNSTGKGRVDYLPQGKRFAQAMIDAVQSKGLYGFAGEAVNGWYRSMLYVHLMFILLPNEKISDDERIKALDSLYKSADNAILLAHLSEMPGIKYRLFHMLYKLKLSKLLIAAVKIQSGLSEGK